MIEASHEIAEAKKQNVPRAKTILSELMMTAMDYLSKYQQKMLAFECEPRGAIQNASGCSRATIAKISKRVKSAALAGGK